MPTIRPEGYPVVAVGGAMHRAWACGLRRLLITYDLDDIGRSSSIGQVNT